MYWVIELIERVDWQSFPNCLYEILFWVDYVAFYLAQSPQACHSDVVTMLKNLCLTAAWFSLLFILPFMFSAKKKKKKQDFSAVSSRLGKSTVTIWTVFIYNSVFLLLLTNTSQQHDHVLSVVIMLTWASFTPFSVRTHMFTKQNQRRIYDILVVRESLLHNSIFCSPKYIVRKFISVFSPLHKRSISLIGNLKKTTLLFPKITIKTSILIRRDF